MIISSRIVTLSSLLLLLGFYVTGQAQNSNALIYHENNQLIYEASLEKIALGQKLFINKSALPMENKVLDYFDNLPEELKISENFVLFSAVQSPFNGNWAYMERKSKASFEWNLWLYEQNSKSYRLIFTHVTCPVQDMALAPFGFSAMDKLLLEANNFKTFTDFQGIWELNISSDQVSSISLSGKYLGTPVVSLDGKQMAYTATSEEMRGLVHSKYDEIWVMDTNSKSDAKIAEGKSFKLVSWTELSTSNLPITKTPSYSRAKSSVTSFKMPFPKDVTYYITRVDNPPPPSGPGNGTPNCTSEGPPHGRPAHDWSNRAIVNGVFQEEFTAMTDGTVVFAGATNPTGFGTLILIEMSDGNLAYYGHPSSIFVSNGACVSQGQLLGREGQEGNSTGEHLHTEFRAPSGSSSTAFYLPMEDCGNCIPNVTYCYTSTNDLTECGACDEDIVLDGNDSVTSGQAESYEADQCIQLLPGFDGANGSVVDLQIVPCENQTRSTSQENN